GTRRRGSGFRARLVSRFLLDSRAVVRSGWRKYFLGSVAPWIGRGRSGTRRFLHRLGWQRTPCRECERGLLRLLLPGVVLAVRLVQRRRLLGPSGSRFPARFLSEFRCWRVRVGSAPGLNRASVRCRPRGLVS